MRTVEPGGRGARWTLAAATLLLAAAAPARAEGMAAPGPGSDRLALLVRAGFLGSPGEGGAALAAGLRYRALPHLALALDLGYGLLAARAEVGDVGRGQVEDRWWVVPTVALALSAGAARLEVGGGLGIATASRFASLGAWSRDRTVWEVQVIPSVAAYALAALPVPRRCALFLRLDLTLPLVEGAPVALRAGGPQPSSAEAMWLMLSLGVERALL